VSIICDFVDEYFGIDANLMSLGAIDFGIIIDGAVIIVSSLRFK
jgi:cobalt-zinc-cadmium resistance protein CzcA